ncbi:Sulfotransfer 1 domain containing protein [Asbolus verrucosus]|uniref:Sulfotransfer 1 domain containing protein n=1 Tax=Asbolus verrucosus TaxID=1661398 RepID=A0A482WCM3_ASBVE|nr:Sulfotransfer 1 domain containing protein [Asbolus verrucosus]
MIHVLQVPERIRAMNASVKLLLIVREPVTRAISDYTQLRANAATASPTTATPPPKSFESLSLFPNGSINEAYRPLAISVYHNYLHRWLEVFPREQILVVNGDLLIEDPVPQIQKIERFLGLEPRIGTHNFYFNETKGFYCLRNETSDRCLRETKGRKHPRVDPNVVSKLRKYFGEHNQKFYELIGEDLGWPEE